MIEEVVEQLLGIGNSVPDAPLLHHDVMLALHVLGIDDGIAGPVAKQQQARVHQQRVVHGNGVQLIAHRREAREGIGVMTELQAVAAEEVDHTAGEMLRALEQHVFHEVGNAPLVVLLHDGASLHQQIEERLLRGLVVSANVVGQSVAQHALAHRRVFRNHLFVDCR